MESDEVLWDVARPVRSSRLAGVSMAGFRDRGRTPPGLRLIPPPAVTLALVFGPGTVTLSGGSGWPRQGSVVAGLGFGPARLRRAEGFECVQVRLPPAVAGAVLGVRPADLGRAFVALDDVWGREAARLGERLSETASWEERFALT